MIALSGVRVMTGIALKSKIACRQDLLWEPADTGL